MRDGAGARQGAERTVFDVAVAARMPCGVVRAVLSHETRMTNLQRERAIGRRHVAGGNHRLKYERNQQRAGYEPATASSEESSCHMAMWSLAEVGLPRKVHMAFELQPRIENQWIKLEPLTPGDFEALYAVAADPLIWELHPTKSRYQRDVFATYFKGALDSGGAFRVIDNTSGALIGSSRYYDLDEAQGLVNIGYTFIARRYWNGAYNRALKSLMLGHAFRFVDRVIFHVGSGNLRSRRAMEKLGAVLIGEVAMSYSGEASHLNVIYKIDRADWVRPKEIST